MATVISKDVTYNGSVGGSSFVVTIKAVDELLVNSDSFLLTSLLPSVITCKVKWAYAHHGGFYANMGIRLGGKSSSAGGDTGWGSWANGRVLSPTITKSTPAIQTSSIFNSSNKTTRIVNVILNDVNVNGENEDSYYLTMTTFGGTSSINLGQRIVLNVPPTFTKSAMTFDTPWIYAGLTTASVDVDDITAYYEGYIVEAKLTIGNRNVVLTGDETNILSSGTLSMLLEEVGTFTPTITVTDSRGQTKTEELSQITVLGYVAPSVNLSIQRTLNTGVPADEGTYATVTARFTFTDAIATLEEPTVSVSGLPSATATWYTTRDSQTGAIDLTSEVDWNDTSGISSGDTLYALIGTFQPNESYVINVTPIDSQGTGTPMSITLPTAFYTIDFLAGGHGIAFGQPSTQQGFFCNMEAHYKDKANVMRALFDFVRPVGSAYPTVDASFDPNVSWGGTWEKLPEGYILLSGSDSGSYIVGDDSGTSSGYKEYGENSHIQTGDEAGQKALSITGGSHTHSYTTYSTRTIYQYKNNDSAARFSATTGTASGGSHTHDVSASNATQAMSLMQKSIAVYWWIRTA